VTVASVEGMPTTEFIDQWTWHKVLSGKSPLAALAIPDSLGRQRWIPTSSWGQQTDSGGDCLNQQAERNDQQRESCARRMDVGLEPGFICHAVSLEQTISIKYMWIAVGTKG
jgi:hypothetical protein